VAIRTCSEVRSGDARHEDQERSGRVCGISTPPGHPPRGSVNFHPPDPPPQFDPIPTSKRGGVDGYAQFVFFDRIRRFFNVSSFRSKKACSGCFFDPPRKRHFFHFFCHFEGVQRNPSKTRNSTPVRGGNPSAVYVFYSVLHTIRTA
jgi:hypothetical protein